MFKSPICISLSHMRQGHERGGHGNTSIQHKTWGPWKQDMGTWLHTHTQITNIKMKYRHKDPVF